MADRNFMPKDVAEALGVSVDTVGRYAREGLIPFAATPKGHRRFDLAEVRVALADIESPGMTRLRPTGRGVGSSGSRLVLGPAVRPSASSLLQEELRATRTAPTASDEARTPHPDVLERDVLPKAAEVVRRLAKKFAAGLASEPEVRLVGATERWYLGGNDKRVLFIPMLSEASARGAKLWRAEAGEFDETSIAAGAKRLAAKVRAGLPAGGGYTCSVEPATLHGTSAADLLEWSEWVVEVPPDPLADDAT